MRALAEPAKSYESDNDTAELLADCECAYMYDDTSKKWINVAGESVHAVRGAVENSEDRSGV